jgi:hypothetical protein
MLKIFLFSLALSSTILVAAQSSIPEKIAAGLDSFSFYRPQEKAYLQTDRTEFVTGETIWFKAYLLLNEEPSILSRVVYVDMIDQNGAVIEKKMLEVKKGVADGNLTIKDDQLAGVYYLRCYTLWMLNFPSFIPEKKIIVFNNKVAPKQKSRTAENASASINFFPEGGNLIAGLKSIVAFKALDENGKPFQVNGDIFNSKNEKVTSFTSTHDGMGIFELQALPNELYSASIQLPGGQQKKVQLPAVKPEGITLTIDNNNSLKTFLKVERSEKNAEKYNSLLVVAQMNYQVVYVGKLNFDEGLDAASINKKNLLPGIIQVTVLTENGIPLAERLVFVANHILNNTLLQPGVTNLEKRKKNTISLDASGFTNLQAAVAVTNADGENAKYVNNILSSLLLTSDIKGNVNDAGYYFKDKEPETLKHLDLVMLTNGWRRFNLEEVMNNKLPDLHYSFETGLSVTGKVLQSNGKTELKEGKINLILKGEDSTSIMSEAKTNDASVFVVDKLGFTKGATIYYQGSNIVKKEAIVVVKIDSAYFDTLHFAQLNAKYFGDVIKPAVPLQQILSGKKNPDSVEGKVLEAVVVRARKRSETDSLNSLYATDLFYSSDQTLVVSEKINYYDMWQFLRMMVPGIIIDQTDAGMQVKFSRYEGLDLFSENVPDQSVQFFLNEVPVNISLIDGLNPSDVAMVKVFKGVSGIALGASRGAIAFYTVKGRSLKDWRQKGFDFFTKSGYSVSREFYQMDYSKINPETAQPDKRMTLYWNPSITIKDGKSNIEFYNDDICKKFKIVIEGVDATGKLLHIEKEIR